MLKLQRQDIAKLKNGRTVSSNTGPEDGSYNANCLSSYDHVFPALPDSKTLSPKSIGINGQCAAVNAPPKLWSKVRASTVNQVFTIYAEDRGSNNSEQFGKGESNHIYSQITRETGAEIEISTSKNINLTFLVRGKELDVAEAKRRIIASFQTQTTTAVPVPKEHHRQVIGKQGTRRKEIEQRTGARIQMPSIQDTSDVINVTGTRDSVKKAVQEIRMISDELSKKAFEKIKIPKMFHPSITGDHNEKLNNLMKETGVKIHVPPPSVNSDEITNAGDKKGVQAAIENIKKMYTIMEKESATVFVKIPKQQHKYLTTQKGSGIQDILLKTNVSVEMPQQDSHKETVTLRGLYKDLGTGKTGLTKLYKKAGSMTAKTIDCPGWMYKFLIGKNGSNLREFIEDNEKVHVKFSGDNKIIVEGPTNMISKVIDSLKNAIECYVSIEILVDQKFFKHIIGKNGRNINRVKNDTGVVISISESDNNSNIIRIEGQKYGVELAKSELEKMIFKLENEVEKEISIDQRHHRVIIGVKGEKVRELQEILNVQITFPSSVEARNNLVKIRGLNEDVNKALKSLAILAKELDEANCMLEIPVFKQLNKLIVGKGGAYIKKIREETDTRIDLPREGEDSNTIKVMGNKEKVLIACDMIKKMQDEMRDIVTKEIVLGNVKVRNVIVNLGNKFIQSIKEDCGGNVTLKLPTVKGDNTIVIKGSEDGVDSAITQIQTMVDEVHNSVINLKVKPEFHKYLIGKKRANVKRIRVLTNTRIIFPPESDSTNENITIVGKKDNVNKAKTEFEVIMIDINNVIEERVDIKGKYHKSFVAKCGESYTNMKKNAV